LELVGDVGPQGGQHLEHADWITECAVAGCLRPVERLGTSACGMLVETDCRLVQRLGGIRPLEIICGHHDTWIRYCLVHVVEVQVRVWNTEARNVDAAEEKS